MTCKTGNIYNISYEDRRTWNISIRDQVLDILVSSKKLNMYRHDVIANNQNCHFGITLMGDLYFQDSYCVQGFKATFGHRTVIMKLPPLTFFTQTQHLPYESNIIVKDRLNSMIFGPKCMQNLDWNSDRNYKSILQTTVRRYAHSIASFELSEFSVDTATCRHVITERITTMVSAFIIDALTQRSSISSLICYALYVTNPKCICVLGRICDLRILFPCAGVVDPYYESIVLHAVGSKESRNAYIINDSILKLIYGSGSKREAMRITISHFLENFDDRLLDIFAVSPVVTFYRMNVKERKSQSMYENVVRISDLKDVLPNIERYLNAF
jgi:hypothetical protein